MSQSSDAIHESGKITKEVRGLSFLAMAGGVIVLGAVLMMFSRLTRLAEAIAGAESARTACVERIDGRIAVYIEVADAALKGSPVGAQMRTLDEPLDTSELLRAVARLSDESSVDELRAEIDRFNSATREARRLAGRVRTWRATVDGTSELKDSASAVCDARLDSLSARIDSLHGRARLQQRAQLRALEHLPAAEQGPRALEILRASETTSGLSEARRSVAEIALAVSDLNGETSPDAFASIRENQLAPVLQRLRGQVAAIGNAELSESFNACETALFTYEGQRGLYDYALDSATLRAQRDSLSAEVARRGDALRESQLRLLGTLSHHAASATEAARVHMSRSVLAIAVIAAVVGVLFVFSSRKVLRSIASQLEAIEDANRCLDQAAELAASEVAERRIAEEQLIERARQLEQAKKEAEAASRAKSDFLANMSHEIRTPMTAILGYADLICDQSSAPEERASMIASIRRNGEALMTVINDILDISKIEAGGMTVESVPCDVASIVDELASLMRDRAAGKGVSLILETTGELRTPSHTDPTRLRQILLNLLANAVKFTQAGEISFRAVRTSPSTLEFRVSDSGIGMSQEQLALLFKPFTQADNTMARRFGGTGLGLAISQRLAQLLGGGVAVTSAPGVGSTFTLTIQAPIVAGAEPSAGDTPQSVPPDALAGRRVLLAEDGPDNQRLICYHLRKAGAHVTVAENGRLAVEAFRAAAARGEHFDVICMDMQMPDMDGYAAAALLRADGVGTPIIALTAHAMNGDRAKCIDAGCSDYQTKPVDRARLIEACERWCSSRRAA